MGWATAVPRDSTKCQWVSTGMRRWACTRTRDSPWVIRNCSIQWLTTRVSNWNDYIFWYRENCLIKLFGFATVYNNSDWTSMDPAILSFRQYSSFPQNQIPPHPQQQQDLFLQHLAQQQNSQSGGKWGNQEFTYQQSIKMHRIVYLQVSTTRHSKCFLWGCPIVCWTDNKRSRHRSMPMFRACLSF